MSYSIGVRAATKAEAKQELAAKFDETVVAFQPVHATDRDQALAAASAFIDILPDDESRDVVISMNGYLSGQWEGAAITTISTASVTVAASLVAKEATKA